MDRGSRGAGGRGSQDTIVPAKDPIVLAKDHKETKWRRPRKGEEGYKKRPSGQKKETTLAGRRAAVTANKRSANSGERDPSMRYSAAEGIMDGSQVSRERKLQKCLQLAQIMSQISEMGEAMALQVQASEVPRRRLLKKQQVNELLTTEAPSSKMQTIHDCQIAAHDAGEPWKRSLQCISQTTNRTSRSQSPTSGCEADKNDQAAPKQGQRRGRRPSGEAAKKPALGPGLRRQLAPAQTSVNYDALRLPKSWGQAA